MEICPVAQMGYWKEVKEGRVGAWNTKSMNAWNHDCTGYKEQQIDRKSAGAEDEHEWGFYAASAIGKPFESLADASLIALLRMKNAGSNSLL